MLVQGVGGPTNLYAKQRRPMDAVRPNENIGTAHSLDLAPLSNGDGPFIQK
jgi:hypothetical protein